MTTFVQVNGARCGWCGEEMTNWITPPDKAKGMPSLEVPFPFTIEQDKLERVGRYIHAGCGGRVRMDVERIATQEADI